MSRWRYFLRRLVLAVPVVLLGLTITFVIVRMGPIDPAVAILGEQTDPRLLQNVREQLGLNEPLWVQYRDFMISMLTFDLGQSWVIQEDRQVTTLLRIYGPRTIWLGFWSVLIALFVGIPLGFFAGLHPNTPADYVASFGGIVWRAMPNFWLAVMLLAILRQTQDFFGFRWHTLGPDIGSLVGQAPLDFVGITQWATIPLGITTVSVPIGIFVAPGVLASSIKQILPPAIVLGSASMGNEMRIGRTAVLETINSNYVETARAKGLSGRVIVWKHVFRNALIPLVPIITNEAFLLLGGSVIVEVIFGINGIGYLFFQATVQGDLPLVGSLMFVFILLIVFVNILQDLLYTVLDPRVGYER